MMIKVKPANGGRVVLPSGLAVVGSSEIEKTKEVARALRFGDLLLDSDVNEQPVIRDTAKPDTVAVEATIEDEGE